ncbi:hypothetical protein VTI74DRAFT_11600 [Chaetomium olivicolor]
MKCLCDSAILVSECHLRDLPPVYSISRGGVVLFPQPPGSVGGPELSQHRITCRTDPFPGFHFRFHGFPKQSPHPILQVCGFHPVANAICYYARAEKEGCSHVPPSHKPFSAAENPQVVCKLVASIETARGMQPFSPTATSLRFSLHAMQPLAQGLHIFSLRPARPGDPSPQPTGVSPGPRRPLSRWHRVCPYSGGSPDSIRWATEITTSDGDGIYPIFASAHLGVTVSRCANPELTSLPNPLNPKLAEMLRYPAARCTNQAW